MSQLNIMTLACDQVNLYVLGSVLKFKFKLVSFNLIINPGKKGVSHVFLSFAEILD